MVEKLEAFVCLSAKNKIMAVIKEHVQKETSLHHYCCYFLE